MKTQAEKNARKQRRREQGPPDRKMVLCNGSDQPTGHRNDGVKCPMCGKTWNGAWVTVPIHSRPVERP